MNSTPQAFRFEFRVDAAHPALPGHFPGNPVVPGAVMLAEVLAGVSAKLSRAVSAVKQVKFTASLLPEEMASVECEAGANEVRFEVQTIRKGCRVRLASGSLTLRHASP